MSLPRTKQRNAFTDKLGSATELAAEGLMMKSMKVAAAVAGSLAVVGAAAPAFAAGDLPPMSLNGGLDTIARSMATAQMVDTAPVRTNLLDPKSDDSLMHTVAGTARDLNKTNGGTNPGQLLGGLPVGQ
ncbi:hypothetical protein [Streptomyces sp. NPDC048111]|uniref:hypothetical protein n=1 Tax=Streptomyces sp. NPDC048111 TaxID=3365500 RepID=UPI0037221C35